MVWIVNCPTLMQGNRFVAFSVYLFNWEMPKEKNPATNSNPHNMILQWDIFVKKKGKSYVKSQVKHELFKLHALKLLKKLEMRSILLFFGMNTTIFFQVSHQRDITWSSHIQNIWTILFVAWASNCFNTGLSNNYRKSCINTYLCFSARVIKMAKAQLQIN